MDFAAILDGIARSPKSEEAPVRLGGDARAPEFWQVLDRIADAPPVSDETLKAAYFDEDFVAAPLPEDAPATELSIDPDDIAYELALSDVVSLDELSVLRRRFAMLNHPDRTRPEDRDRATARMTIANAMIDAAAARLSR